jgi:hypothetical protein
MAGRVMPGGKKCFISSKEKTLIFIFLGVKQLMASCKT